MANANAVIAGRNFKVFTKAHAMANDIPADTVLYGTAWAGYVDRGYTTGGLGMAMNVDRGEIRVDQEFDPITLPATGRNITMTTELAEMTAANLQLGGGLGAITSVAAMMATRGHDDLDIGATVADAYYTWGFDILQPDGEAFRVVTWKGLATGSPSPQFTPDSPATIACEVTALVDTTTTPSRVMKVRDVIPVTG